MSGSTGAQSSGNSFNYYGSQQSPIAGSQSSFGSNIDTVNLQYADLTVTGSGGLNNPHAFNLGISSTLRLQTGVAGGSVNFNSSDNHLVFQSGTNPAQLTGIYGFQPGNTIDVTALAASMSYADNAGTGTGGTLTLYNASGGVVSTLQFGSGDYVRANFQSSTDSTGGTLVTYATAVSGVTASPANGDLGVGQQAVISVAFTDPVTVSGGTPTLTLNDGGTAIYDASHSTATSLAFTYTVGAGQNTSDLAVTGLSPNGATIVNAGNTPVDYSGVIANPAGTLQVDTTAPILSNLVASPGTADLGAGQVVQLSVSANEAVTVAGGSPSLTLNDGGIAIYSASLSTPTKLTFVYTVAAGQNTSDLAVTAAALNGATIADGAGNTTGLLNAVGNPSGTLQIDTIAPLVTGVGITPSDGTLTPGQTATISVGVSEPVSVTGGVPTLALSDGGTATYDPVNSTSTKLVFTHTVQSGQSTSDLAITGYGTNGATVADGAGNQLNLTGAIGNPSGTLQVNGSTTGSGSSGGTSTGSGSSAGTSTGAATATLPVYRFFDTTTGTHFFTADANEKGGLMSSSSRGYRPDLVEETNNFGAIDPNSSDPNKIQVYRFFDTVHGTHFFTASQTEMSTLTNSNSTGYRPDLVFEAASSFYEHSTQQSGDVAVYRFFDTTYGTHFYTGSQNEYVAITTTGGPLYRSDLVSEGVGFYAPSGSFT